MNERELRGLIEQGEDRQAVATRLRAADDGGGPHRADGHPAAGPFGRGHGAGQGRPTSRPSAAAAARSRCCGGRAPTLLNPHFAVGTKDQDGSRLFYEPLAALGSPTATSSPKLAAEIPSRENGGLAADGKSVTWKLKQGVTWHDGKPFTADDVVFNWEYAKDPATAAVTIGSYKDVMVEKIDQYTVVVKFTKPTPFWADAFVGTRGMLIPKHLFADYIGAKSREAPTNLKPVGTGPYMFKDFKPGDMVTGVINPNYHQANKPLFRHDRDEGRRRCGLGGARRAADRRVRLRLEHAGRGRDPVAPGEGRQGPRHHHAGRQHRAHPAQHHRSVDRGRRRALEHQDQASDAAAIRRCARRWRC